MTDVSSLDLPVSPQEPPVSIIYDDGMLRVLLSEEPLTIRLIGQADLTHRAAVAQALRRTERDVGDVIVDLGELEFIDVAGVRQLIDHAGVLAIDGRRIRIIGVRPSVHRILQVCLWPQPPNLWLEDTNGHPQRSV